MIASPPSLPSLPLEGGGGVARAPPRSLHGATGDRLGRERGRGDTVSTVLTTIFHMHDLFTTLPLFVGCVLTLCLSLATILFRCDVLVFALPILVSSLGCLLPFCSISCRLSRTLLLSPSTNPHFPSFTSSLILLASSSLSFVRVSCFEAGEGSTLAAWCGRG